MELTGGGRAGGARGMPGVVVSRPRGRGDEFLDPRKIWMCLRSLLAAGRRSCGWDGSQGPSFFQEAGTGRGVSVQKRNVLKKG